MTTSRTEMDVNVDINARGSTSGSGSTGRSGSSDDGGSGARARVSDAYIAARERTSSVYGSARERASNVRQRTSEGVESSPMVALVGGLAIGAVLGALLPKSRREEELLGDYGRKINERARDAVQSAREAATSKLDELGYNRDTAKEKIQGLKSDAAEIARAAAEKGKSDAKEVASAAAQNAKESVKQ
ncbi:MAG TPA: hypothetical protein VNT25_05825 [Allosphingosinicella sp.]|nr:hypothetical protein [Allosphingosinicella sp.]